MTPPVREMDGVALDHFAPGAIRDVSSTIANWLIAEGYAEPEMRGVGRAQDEFAADAVPLGVLPKIKI